MTKELFTKTALKYLQGIPTVLNHNKEGISKLYPSRHLAADLWCFIMDYYEIHDEEADIITERIMGELILLEEGYELWLTKV